MNAILHQRVTNVSSHNFYLSLYLIIMKLSICCSYIKKINFDITLIRLIKCLHKINWLIPVLETEAKDVEKHT